MQYRRLLVPGLAALAVASVAAALFVPWRLGQAGHGPTPSMEVDAISSGNSANFIGPPDTCAFTFGGSGDVDIVFDGAPALSRAEFDLLYNGSALRVDAVAHNLLFFAKIGGPVTSLSDATPDQDSAFHVGASSATAASGDGVWARLTVSVSLSTTLTIANPIIIDAGGNNITPQFDLRNAEIRVAVTCPHPTPSPTPTPTATATATPTATLAPIPCPTTQLLDETYTNTLTQAASDLHVEYNESVGVCNVRNASGCPQPSVSPGIMVNFDWGTACVDPGEAVAFTIYFSHFQVRCRISAVWTLSGEPIGTAAGGTNCPPSATPTATASPTPTATPAPPPTITPSPTASATPSPCPQCTPTPTLAPSDGAITRLKTPHTIHVRPGETRLATLTVSGTSDSAGFNLYVALLPPGGEANSGGCTAEVLEVISNTQQASFKFPVNWTCTNPAAVDGLHWEVTAFADAHANDWSSCDSLTEVSNGTCAGALADDDSNDANNTKTRSLPKVVAQ